MHATRVRAAQLQIIGVIAAVIAALALTAGANPKTDRIELPDGFQPEGITIGRGGTAWFGSRVDGDVYQANLRTGKGKIIGQGPGTPSVGLKVDHRGRLFIAGGSAGDGRVVDSRSGRILASYQFSTEESFVNDVVLTRYGAWFTDSAAAQLYFVPLGRFGGLPDASDVVTLPITGGWQQGEGFGANGLTTTPDGRALLVVHSGLGELHRVSPFTGESTRVDLGGTLVTNGDGMLRHGRTLYVVQNQLNQIAVIRLDHSGSSGRLVDVITSPDFDVPTTVASYGRWLYLPNGRFTTEPTPATPYWVTRVSKH